MLTPTERAGWTVSDGLGSSTVNVVATDGSQSEVDCVSAGRVEVTEGSSELLEPPDNSVSVEEVELGAGASHSVGVSTAASVDEVASADSAVEEVVESAAAEDSTADSVVSVADADAVAVENPSGAEELASASSGTGIVVHVVMTSTRGSPFSPRIALNVITHSSVIAIPSL